MAKHLHLHPRLQPPRAMSTKAVSTSNTTNDPSLLQRLNRFRVTVTATVTMIQRRDQPPGIQRGDRPPGIQRRDHPLDVHRSDQSLDIHRSAQPSDHWRIRLRVRVPVQNRRPPFPPNGPFLPQHHQHQLLVLVYQSRQRQRRRRLPRLKTLTKPVHGRLPTPPNDHLVPQQQPSCRRRPLLRLVVVMSMSMSLLIV